MNRIRRAGLPCPEVVCLKKHVLVMSFIGHDGKPAPTLKEASLSSAQLDKAYVDTVDIMTRMYAKCNLVSHSSLHSSSATFSHLVSRTGTRRPERVQSAVVREQGVGHRCEPVGDAHSPTRTHIPYARLLQRHESESCSLQTVILLTLVTVLRETWCHCEDSLFFVHSRVREGAPLRQSRRLGADVSGECEKTCPTNSPLRTGVADRRSGTRAGKEESDGRRRTVRRRGGDLLRRKVEEVVGGMRGGKRNNKQDGCARRQAAPSLSPLCVCRCRSSSPSSVSGPRHPSDRTQTHAARRDGHSRPSLSQSRRRPPPRRRYPVRD